MKDDKATDYAENENRDVQKKERMSEDTVRTDLGTNVSGYVWSEEQGTYVDKAGEPWSKWSEELGTYVDKAGEPVKYEKDSEKTDVEVGSKWKTSTKFSV